MLNLVNADWEYEGLEVPINNLPSVTPTRPEGEWITLEDEYGDVVEAVCSKCKSNGMHTWEYCPNCGADMREDKNENSN